MSMTTSFTLFFFRDGISHGASHLVTSPRACALPSPELALVRNQGPMCALRGASHTLTSPRACNSTRADEEVCYPRLAIRKDTPCVIGEVAPFINGSDILSMGGELQFGGETYGASRQVTSPRACVSNPHGVAMPIYGSHDVRSDDVRSDVVDNHHITIFINRDAYGEVRDALYETSCEGSEGGILNQGRHIPGNEGAEICGGKLGRWRNREYHERLSFPSLMTIPPSPSLAAVLSDQGPVCPGKPLVDISGNTTSRSLWAEGIAQ
jgi:hypothetical protein